MSQSLSPALARSLNSNGLPIVGFLCVYFEIFYTCIKNICSVPLGAEKYCFPHSLSNFKYIECNISGYFTEIFSELKAFGIGHMVSNNISTMGCQTVPVVSCNSGGTQAA